jgi:hypothetical protein
MRFTFLIVTIDGSWPSPPRYSTPGFPRALCRRRTLLWIRCAKSVLRDHRGLDGSPAAGYAIAVSLKATPWCRMG